MRPRDLELLGDAAIVERGLAVLVVVRVVQFVVDVRGIEPGRQQHGDPVADGIRGRTGIAGEHASAAGQASVAGGTGEQGEECVAHAAALAVPDAARDRASLRSAYT